MEKGLEHRELEHRRARQGSSQIRERKGYQPP